jgi:hypothetical protein
MIRNTNYRKCVFVHGLNRRVFWSSRYRSEDRVWFENDNVSYGPSGMYGRVEV